MFMRVFVLAFLMCFSLVLFTKAPAHAAGGSESIAVVVNEDAITRSDLNDRLKLIMVSSGMPNSDEIKAKLMPQIITAMVDEQIRLQAAKKKGIEVSREEINSGFAEIAGQNNLEPAKFREMLEKAGLNVDTMETQIKAQLAWAKVVQQEIRPRIAVSDSDVDNRLEMIKGNMGKTEYLLAEIYLPVDDAKKEADTKQLAMQLVKDIRAGHAPFFKVAKQFSQSAGAERGGDMGWIQLGQLSQEIDQVLPSIGANNISDPIRTLSGYHIVAVRDQRTITPETLPSREEIYNTIGLERLQRQASRYLMDLKAAAYIDNRLAS